jgi:hypothetical protein
MRKAIVALVLLSTTWLVGQQPDGPLEMVLRPTGAVSGVYGGPGKDLTITVDPNGRIRAVSDSARPPASTLPFSLTATSKVLTLGADCTPTTPCKVGFTNQAFAISQPATVTLSTGTGAAFLYVKRDGQMGVSSKALTLTCDAGCTRDTTQEQFAADSFMLYRCDATAGVWTLPCQDWRAPYRRDLLDAGSGIAVAKGGAANQVMVDRVGLRYGKDFTATDTVLIPFADHQIGSPDLIVSCRSSATPSKVILPDSISITPTFDVTIRFLSPNSGRCSVL